MPLFKCSASKAKPKNGIAYVTDEKKAKIVTVRNLFEDEDYAKQFEETASRFGKGDKFDERKYYHCKLSCARQDNVSPEKAHAYAEELVAKLFQNYECVIATHTDTQTVHSHIIVNAVDPITGKKLQFSQKDYAKMKDEVNVIGRKYGFTETEFRKRGKNSRTAAEKKIILKGGTSWKEELREVIAEAVKKTKSPEAFKKYLDECYGVKIMRDGKDYSYLHPNKQKPIRGERLGINYTKSEVIKKIGEQNNGGSIIRASLSGIEREMQRLNFAAECAGNGLNAASEERKMDERRARLEFERRRREVDERDERRKSEHACEHADNSSENNGNGNEDTGNSKYNYGKGD